MSALPSLTVSGDLAPRAHRASAARGGRATTSCTARSALHRPVGSVQGIHSAATRCMQHSRSKGSCVHLSAKRATALAGLARQRLGSSAGASRASRRSMQVHASLFGVGAPEALVIGVVALLVFGPKGLADIAKQLGQTLRAFQPTIRELQEVSREFKETLEDEIGLDEIRNPPPAVPKPKPRAADAAAPASPLEAESAAAASAMGAKEEVAAGAEGAEAAVTEEMKRAAAEAAWGAEPPAAAAADASAAAEPAPPNAPEPPAPANDVPASLSAPVADEEKAK